MADMQYVQMTLDDWMALKGRLEMELKASAAGFVRIGYILRKIEESEGYRNEGYDSLTEWAKDSYGLSASTVSRFMAINRKYSLDGYSEQLKLEYAEFGSAKLSEMLALPDEDLEMVDPKMKREDIREIKKFNKEATKEQAEEEHDADQHEEPAVPVEEEKEPPAAAAQELPNILPEHRWIIEFFKENKETMNELYSSKAFAEGNTDGMKEIVNPAGARTFRHKMTMVSMMEARIMVKVFPASPAPMSWEGFFKIAGEIFEGKIDGPNTYRNVFGEDEPARNAAETARNPKNAAEPKKEEPAAGVQKAEHDEHIPTQDEQKSERNEQISEDLVKKTSDSDEKEIAPAQKEVPSIEEFNVKTDSPIAENTPSEEPEQVEIDDILPAPEEPDRHRDLTDRFLAELNTLKIMLESGNYESMEQNIERLEHLRIKLMEVKDGTRIL